MEITIESHVVGDDLRFVAERRARFAFRRLHWLASRARIHLADVNGPRGGVNKQCSVSVEVPGAPPLVVSSLSRDWRTALDTALHRATRGLLRSWRKREAPKDGDVSPLARQF